MATSFRSLVKSFSRNKSGATLVEYAVLVGLVTAAIVVSIGLLGDQINTSFTNITTRLTASNTNNQ